MVCPACKHAWFHRACIQVGALLSPCRCGSIQQHQALLILLVFLLQGQATCTGIKCFQCPHCRNKDKFKSEMFIMGIQIPDRLVSCWLSRHEGKRPMPAQRLPQQAQPFAACELWSHLHGGAGNGVRVEKQGYLGSSLVQEQWGLIIFPPFTDRRPVWEDNDAYALLGNRHRRCDVSECLYQRGREQAEEEG